MGNLKLPSAKQSVAVKPKKDSMAKNLGAHMGDSDMGDKGAPIKPKMSGGAKGKKK